jgi:putative nucleotidyltransferase with HDIG domain
VTRDHESLPSYLAPWADAGLRSVVLLPILLGQRLAAIIALGYLEAAGPDPDDQSHARQLVDQVAVALANARLIEDLDRLNWGTLNALARAIDAKSPWTAGHSERVTELALQIGQTLNLGPQRLAVLHRGGLLHDLGKLGIPPEILDKPGRLTPEETRIMQGHVTLGARILEPIAAYAEVIPILLQHHESFDGSGYPVGLAGEAIDLGARIFGVADVFDALLSDRPYRRGLDREEVIRYIRDRSGRQFDPRVVEAFLEVMTRQRSGIQAKAQEERVGRS